MMEDRPGDQGPGVSDGQSAVQRPQRQLRELARQIAESGEVPD